MSESRGMNGSDVSISQVPKSPALANGVHTFKRQRNDIEGTYSDASNSGYNSGADDGDDLFDGVVLTTPQKDQTQTTQNPSKYVTQPTQIIDRGSGAHPLSSSPMRSSELQVPASSPYRPQSPTQKVQSQSTSQVMGHENNGRPRMAPQGYRAPPPSVFNKRPQPSPLRAGRLGSAMAPAGTSFKTPHGVVRQPVKPIPKPIILDLSDDEAPAYKGDSSDDGRSVGTNIVPTSIGSRAKVSNDDESRAKMPAAATGSFSSIVQAARYEPNASTVRKTDSMSDAYGGRRPPPQRAPARAQPVQQELSIDDIDDEEMRRKIFQMRNVLDKKTVLECRNALMSHKMSTEDAMNSLVDFELLTDDELQTTEAQTTSQAPVSMKATLNGHVGSIRDRYGHIKIQPSTQSSQASPPPKPPKKRLVQGRRKRESSPPDPSPAKVEAAIELSDTADSGVEDDEPIDDRSFDGRLLQYLNKASASDIADLTSMKLEIAEGFVAARPYKTLTAAEAYSDAPQQTKSGKKSRKAAVGEKLVDNAASMMEGYEAVDYVVRQCENLSKPLKGEMAKWGVNVNGGGSDTGLELTSLAAEDSDGAKDSGIGTPSSKFGDDVVRVTNGRTVRFLKQPANMNPEYPAKDYQLVGLNWLNLIYKNGLSCILADDMGLGKTFQVISFLSHLVETGDSGPHLVIVPSSVLENWLREFEKFSPTLAVEPYAGSQAERAELAEQILERRDETNVVLASYDNARRPDDSKFLRRLRATTAIFDEGHALKNPESARYKTLMRVPAQMRVLLTGTPLQNNLKELAAVLAFILPEIFSDKWEQLEYIFKHRATTSDTDHAALLSAQRTQRARSMLTPFVLRRKKEQVMQHLPPKTCRVEYCSLTSTQRKIYNGFVSRAAEIKRKRAEGIPTDDKGENNPVMQLRKAAIHPMLFRRHFTDDKLKKMLPILRNLDDFAKQRDDQIMGEMQYHSDYVLHGWCLSEAALRKFDTPDLAWMDSGKVSALVKLVNKFKANGDRVLIFSQFVMVLDILEAVLDTSLIKYTRIDGSTAVDLRQTRIDQFRDDEDITAFLLSTGAGGQGINLMYANKVIIFDQSFNPQDDVQAENRAHRVGQTREVEVVRLICKGTIEEAMYTLGQSKLALDYKVSGAEDAKAEASFQKLMESKVLEALDDGQVAEVEENGSGESSPNQPAADVLESKDDDKGDESSELSELDDDALE